MRDILFYVLEMAVMVIMAIITRHLIPLIKTAAEESESELFRTVVSTIVRAVEMMIREKGAGSKKYDLAVELIRRAGIKLTDEQIQILIEAAVQAMNAEKNTAAFEIAGIGELIEEPEEVQTAPNHSYYKEEKDPEAAEDYNCEKCAYYDKKEEPATCTNEEAPAPVNPAPEDFCPDFIGKEDPEEITAPEAVPEPEEKDSEAEA